MSVIRYNGKNVRAPLDHGAIEGIGKDSCADVSVPLEGRGKT